MFRTRWLRAAALAGALALLAAACGGDDAEPETDAAAEAEDVEEAPEPDEPADEPDEAESEPDEPADEPDAAGPEGAEDAGAWCAEAVGNMAVLDPGDFDEDDVPLDEAIQEMHAAIAGLERMTAVAPSEIRAETALAVELFEVILDVTETVHRAGGDEDDVDAALWDDQRVTEDQLQALDAMFSYLATNC